MAMKFVADELIIRISKTGNDINQYIRESIEDKLERDEVKL